MTAPIIAPLSTFFRGIRDFLQTGLTTANTSVRVCVGSPLKAQPSLQATDHRLNIFFYRMEPAGAPHLMPGETWLFKVHCLITPYSVGESIQIAETTLSEGEHDLHILGEVVRLFHEQNQQTITIDEESFFVETLFESLTMEQINQIWSPLGDAEYRPSVGFEMNVVPVMPASTRVESPKVGHACIQVGVQDGHSAQLSCHTVPLDLEKIDTSIDMWIPRLCFIRDGVGFGAAQVAVSEGVAPTLDFDLLVAGQPGTEIELVWHLWDQQSGWQESLDSHQTISVQHNQLDPATTPTEHYHQLTPPASTSQAILYAQRQVNNVTLRSTPLLISFYTP